MSTFFGVGLRCARQCAFRGAAAVAAAAMPQPARPKAGPTKDNTTAAQKSSFFGVGLRCARRWPSGVLLRWMLLLCHSRHGRRPGPQKDNNTAAQQKSSFFGVGLRCARQCALRGAAAVDPAAAGLLEHRTFCRATRTEDLCRATRTEDLCRAASASPPSASAFTSPLPPARC